MKWKGWVTKKLRIFRSPLPPSLPVAFSWEKKKCRNFQSWKTHATFLFPGMFLRTIIIPVRCSGEWSETYEGVKHAASSSQCSRHHTRGCSNVTAATRTCGTIDASAGGSASGTFSATSSGASSNQKEGSTKTTTIHGGQYALRHRGAGQWQPYHIRYVHCVLVNHQYTFKETQALKKAIILHFIGINMHI